MELVVKNDNLIELDSKEIELPALQGTPRQVAWANTLRTRILSDISKIRDISEIAGEPVYNGLVAFQGGACALLFASCCFIAADVKQYVIDRLCAIDSASWFIDNRYSNDKEICNTFEDDYADYAAEKQYVNSSDPAKSDVTIRPTDYNEVDVNISNIGDSLVAHCKINYGASVIFKKHSLKWDGLVWKRHLSQYTGDYIDRASELANDLLLNGYGITCHNEIVRNNAISGNFNPECEYWIMAVKDCPNKLYISFFKHNDTIYNAARNIPSAHWNRSVNALEVDISHLKELLAFADDIGMKISKRAQEVIANYNKSFTSVNVNEHTDKLADILTQEGVIDELKD